MRFYITSASWNGEAVLIEHFQMIEVDCFGEPIDIINAFQGEEALDLYKKLVTKKEQNHEY